MTRHVREVGRRLPLAVLVGTLVFFLIPSTGLAARPPVQHSVDDSRGAQDGVRNATATIGGSVYTGANDGTGLGGAIFAPDPLTPPINDAKVMIEDAEGNFVAYPTVVGNTWSATVAVPGEYVVLASAPGHDMTSRRFRVQVADSSYAQDFYLPPLPLPLANLYVYCFRDWVVNGEPDAFDEDPPLDGVLLQVYNEDGDQVAAGITGSGLGPDGINPVPEGHYYFTGLDAGTYQVKATPILGVDMYHTYSDAGSQLWTIPIYPGDPGTEDGGALIWFGFVEKLGQIPNERVPAVDPDASMIHGVLWDADDPVIDALAPDDGEEEFLGPIPPCAFGNSVMPDGKVVLSTDDETYTPVATTEADPVTGDFVFVNVPPGRYKVFCQDIPIDYVWVPAQVQVPPNSIVEVGIDFGDPVGFKHLLPRFFARLQGYVLDGTTNPPTPLEGVKVNLRLLSGREYKTTYSGTGAGCGAPGWYNFDDLEEVEVIAFCDVDPPQGYRWMSVPGDSTFLPDSCLAKIGLDGQYTVQYFSGMNYRVDLWVEPIALTEGDIKGFTWYDSLERGTWVGNGAWKANEEGTIQGVTVNLWDLSMTTLLDTRTSGIFDYQGTVDQGWIPPASQVPVDEFGGVFNALDVNGHFEFTGLAPGDYVLEVIPPPGYSAATPDIIPVTVTAGEWTEADFGLTTQVPRSGLLEGGIWDDLNLDTNPLSIMFMEKAAVVGAPVQVYDHLFYPMDDMMQPDPVPPSTPGMTIHMAAGVHVFYGNDPSHPAYMPNFLPLLIPYGFGQGTAVYEADWSLVPVAFLGVGGPGAYLSEWPYEATNRPVLNGIAGQSLQTAGNPKPGATIELQGWHFGDAQGGGTVTLAGVELPVVDWRNDAISVKLPEKALPGAILVTTPTGISNALPVEIDYSSDPALLNYVLSRSRFVDAANDGFEDGSQTSPFNTIQEALDNLPTVTPRYVFVAPGEYIERVVIRESNVEIIGAGPLETTVSGLGVAEVTTQGVVGGGPVFEIEYGLENIRISGFKITGGTGASNGLGGGIFASANCRNIELSNNIVARNGGTYGGGFTTHYSTHDVTIHSNIFSQNGTFEGYGGGISFSDEPEEFSSPHPQPEHIWDDYDPGPPPGTIEIYNNQFLHNFSVDYGGGASLYETKDYIIIHGNTFLENKADDHGAALFFEDSGPVDIYNNVFFRNFCPDDGGAISFEDVADTLSHINIWNNLFAENMADDRGENHARGGALAFDDVRDAVVFNNTITGNIVSGSYHPAGGGIDGERHGHEYSGEGGPFMAPGYSDPQLFNNIIYDNWRLEYEQPVGTGGTIEGENLDYTWGRNYQWSIDEMHVDNPAINSEWEMYVNSESFTVVENNDIRGGYASGVDNIDVDPGFVNPLAGNFRLSVDSPVIDQGNALIAPATDLEEYPRSVGPNGMIDLGAFEWRPEPGTVMRLPLGVLGALDPPDPPGVVPPPGPLTPAADDRFLDGGQRKGRNAEALAAVRKQRAGDAPRVPITSRAASPCGSMGANSGGCGKAAFPPIPTIPRVVLERSSAPAAVVAEREGDERKATDRKVESKKGATTGPLTRRGSTESR